MIAFRAANVVSFAVLFANGWLPTAELTGCACEFFEKRKTRQGNLAAIRRDCAVRAI